MITINLWTVGSFLGINLREEHAIDGWTTLTAAFCLWFSLRLRFSLRLWIFLRLQHSTQHPTQTETKNIPPKAIPKVKSEDLQHTLRNVPMLFAKMHGHLKLILNNTFDLGKAKLRKKIIVIGQSSTSI